MARRRFTTVRAMLDPSNGPAPSWLAPDPVVERLQLDEASWVDIVRGLVPRADAVHDDLLDAVTWEQGRVFRYERWVEDPRLSSWQAGDARHPALVEVQQWITKR